MAFARPAAVLALLAVAGCAASHAGRTVGRGILQGEVGLGGPLVTNLGPAVPIPNVPLGIRYGVTDRVDFSAHWNVLPVVLGGLVQVDAGFTWAILHRETGSGPNLATGASLMLMTDFRHGARLSPILDIAGGYTYRWFTVFAGFDVVADYAGGGALFNPFAGIEVDLPRRVALQLAAKWFSPAFEGFASPIRYVSVDYRGGIGVLVGIKFGFDLGKRGEAGHAE